MAEITPTFHGKAPAGDAFWGIYTFGDVFDGNSDQFVVTEFRRIHAIIGLAGNGETNARNYSFLVNARATNGAADSFPGSFAIQQDGAGSVTGLHVIVMGE